MCKNERHSSTGSFTTKETTNALRLLRTFRALCGGFLIFCQELACRKLRNVPSPPANQQMIDSKNNLSKEGLFGLYRSAWRLTPRTLQQGTIHARSPWHDCPQTEYRGLQNCQIGSSCRASTTLARDIELKEQANLTDALLQALMPGDGVHFRVLIFDHLPCTLA